MSQYDPTRHHRRSIRHPGYDYTSPGPYFVTICVQNRECLLGDLYDWEMHRNQWGEIVEEEWLQLTKRFPLVVLDAHMVMPNHFHGIIGITEPPSDADESEAGRGVVPTPVSTPIPTPVPTPIPTPVSTPEGEETSPLRLIPGSLGQVMAYFKYQSTKRINALRGAPGVRVWQRNYYDRIVRNDRALAAIRQYIYDNPANWALDPDNPDNSLHLPSPRTIEDYIDDVRRHVARTTRK